MIHRSPIARMRPAGDVRRLVAHVLVATMCLPAPGCVFRRVEVAPVLSQDGVGIVSPVKAHLKDGSTVVYAEGVRISGGVLHGHGARYDLALAFQGDVQELSLHEVVALESFRTGVKGNATTLANLGIVAGVVALPFLALAIFGSCPTVYSEQGGRPVLEAETFSYSIAPLLEARDLDRLRARPDAHGRLRLEVRNEALETHYINHLQLLEVEHQPGELALPDQYGRPIVVGELSPPSRALDRRGRDVHAVLRSADGRAYRTHAATLARVQAGDLEDSIELDVEAPPGAEELALVFRLRNSLLNTVLFYDYMLAPSGARAVDWIGGDLERISDAVVLGRWIQERAGLHVALREGDRYHEVARVPDAGPIAWRDVAATFPVPAGARSLRLRLSFVADAWRIDHMAVAARVRRATPRTLSPTEVTRADGQAEAVARDSLGAADERYLTTQPSQRFFASFDAGPGAPGRARTFLLSSQGYYVEWVRAEWVRSAGAGKRF